jgi:hypothetical protein
VERVVVWLGLAATSVLVTGGCGEHAQVNNRNFAANVTSASQDTFTDGSVKPATATTSVAAGATAPAPATPRKIIYDTRVALLVESLNATERAILNLIKVHDGFLAESDQSSVARTQRTASWRVRVPVDRFDAFLAAVTRLGEVR